MAATTHLRHWQNGLPYCAVTVPDGEPVLDRPEDATCPRCRREHARDLPAINARLARARRQRGRRHPHAAAFARALSGTWS